VAPPSFFSMLFHEGRLVASEDILVTGVGMSVDIHDVEDEDN